MLSLGGTPLVTGSSPVREKVIAKKSGVGRAVKALHSGCSSQEHEFDSRTPHIRGSIM